MKRFEILFFGMATITLILCAAFLYYWGYTKGYETHRIEVKSEVAQAVINSKNNVLKVMHEIEKAQKEIERAKGKNDDCKKVLDFDVRACFD